MGFCCSVVSGWLIGDGADVAIVQSWGSIFAEVSVEEKSHLKFGLHHNFVHKSKYVKVNLATEFESLVWSCWKHCWTRKLRRFSSLPPHINKHFHKKHLQNTGQHVEIASGSIGESRHRGTAWWQRLDSGHYSQSSLHWKTWIYDRRRHHTMKIWKQKSKPSNNHSTEISEWSYPWFRKPKKRRNNNSCPLVRWKT